MKNLGKCAIANDSLPGPSKKCRFASPLYNRKANCRVLPTINSKTHKGTLHGVSVSLRSCATAATKTHVHQNCVLKISCRYPILLPLLATGWQCLSLKHRGKMVITTHYLAQSHLSYLFDSQFSFSDCKLDITC